MNAQSTSSLIDLLPPTRGVWTKIVRGRKTREVVAFMECFRCGDGRLVSIPGASRFINVSDLQG